ncbi:sensor histidine kinase [Candidatus Magnetomonas plexicatena]|uniref:sensor histidine kinase n=1 Tax=Candidatus Magnetomonas plexicatena TaxID=2552947 RepID=UPI00110254AC|nr:hypothetical protein E2O03_005050 [Nitrospirales bacterium LBB_01]
MSIYLFVTTIATVFISEFLIMVLLDNAKKNEIISSEMFLNFADSFILVLLLYPVLYFFVFKPLLVQITERKRIAEELKEKTVLLQDFNESLKSMVKEETTKHRQKEQMLMQQSKMASMGEMIGLIAHQWKQPLNAVTLNVQDFKEAYIHGELDDKYISETVDSTMRQIEFMAKTIDDFRNFFIPSKRKVKFDVKSAIEELLSMFIHIYHRHDVDVTLTVQPDTLLLTEGYPNEFKQVVLNIMNNSKDAIKSRRNSDISISGVIEINIANNEDKSKVIISLKDYGGGIADDVIDNIFEPYFTTKGTEGTGIGLYMSKTIIETNMGGSLTVHNVDGGAEFVISLAAMET